MKCFPCIDPAVGQHAADLMPLQSAIKYICIKSIIISYVCTQNAIGFITLELITNPCAMNQELIINRIVCYQNIHNA